MSLISELKDVSFHQIGVAFAFFLATVAPGSLILLYFKPDLLLHLESLKVVIISGGFTCPLVFWNPFLIWHKERESRPLPYSIGFSLVITSSIIYFSLLVAYFVRLKFSHFVVTVLALEFAVIMVSQFKRLNAEKKAA